MEKRNAYLHRVNTTQKTVTASRKVYLCSLRVVLNCWFSRDVTAAMLRSGDQSPISYLKSHELDTRS